MLNSFDGENCLDMEKGKAFSLSLSDALTSVEFLTLPTYSTTQSRGMLAFAQVAAKE